MIIIDSIIIEQLKHLRELLELHFSAETSFSGVKSKIPSTGHCAVVALIIYFAFNALIVSTKINGVSHWFNRLRINGSDYDFDLTGDQFGFEPFKIDLANSLYNDTRIRCIDEVDMHTFNRAFLLIKKLKAKDECFYNSLYCYNMINSVFYEKLCRPEICISTIMSYSPHRRTTKCYYMI